MNPKYEVNDRVIYYDTEATVLIPPDQFGQLLIYQCGEELWCFEEEVKPLNKKEANHGIQ